jgi:hypothetical protein
MIRVELHPTWTRRGYRYAVTLNGECIITASRDPETDLARALLARGIGDIAEVVDGRTDKPRSRVNIEKAAKLRTVEEDRDGLRFRKHVEHPAEPPPAGETAKTGMPAREAA